MEFVKQCLGDDSPADSEKNLFDRIVNLIQNPFNEENQTTNPNENDENSSKEVNLFESFKHHRFPSVDFFSCLFGENDEEIIKNSAELVSES